MVRKPEAVKPPYRVPPLTEVRERGGDLDVVSSFSGCGGACLGFEIAGGYRIRWASEFVPAAAETYRANHPDVPLSTSDVRQVTAEAILEEAGLDVGDVAVFEGSPPCAAFSSAGRRQALWGQERSYSDTKQRVDDLFAEYARLLAGLRPKAFVAENVAGLARGVAKGYLAEILAALRAPGYRVDVRQLDAQWLGVPQVRRRVIFVGVRDDLGVDPPFPSPFPYRYSIAEALDGLVVSDAEKEEASIADYAIGREWKRLRPGESSDRYFSLVRANPDEPLPTLTATAGVVGAASVAHYDEPRKFTVSELRRLSGFPDDFVLTGTYGQKVERLGRAVVPPMYAAVAARLRDVLA